MNSEEMIQLGERMSVCLLCSVFFFTIFEPLFSYGLQIIGLAENPFALITIVTMLVTVFYVLGYEHTISYKKKLQTS